MRDPLQDFAGDPYHRPNQPWLCGQAQTPCPLGPNAQGVCPAVAACRPVRAGYRWRCNRSAARGGACPEGPSPQGACCQLYQCTPRPSLRLRRGRFVRGCLLATLGGLCLLLSSPQRNALLAPGKLSVQHAHLVRQSAATPQCAQCHAAAEQSFLQWCQHFVQGERAEPSQTTLCLQCHAQQFPAEWATRAHNVDPQLLLQGATNRSRDPAAPLSCATCHQEHHGTDHDLTHMSNQACQACHQQQYQSFASDHPEFDQWPIARRTRIAFDHASHKLKHFPQEKQTYACAGCHQGDATDTRQTTLPYATACASCHDRKLEASWDQGLALFSLPLLDTAALREAGHAIGPWPEPADGEFDGPLSPIVKLLLASDPPARAALLQLGADFDFFDIEADDPAQLRAASAIILACKRLLRDMVTRGHQALRERLEVVLERPLPAHELVPLAARLSPENLAAIPERWLPDLAPSDQRTAIPPRPEEDFQTARSRVEAGGWLRDELGLAIRYLPTGHADPWLTAWIEVCAEAASGPQTKIAQPLLAAMMAPTAAGLCGSCHSVDRDADNQWVVHWHALRGQEGPQFTRFSHGPHLVSTADCTTCHRLDPEAHVMQNYAHHRPTDFEPGFEKLTKAHCAQCHVAGAAGASCQQCHSYHAGKVLRATTAPRAPSGSPVGSEQNVRGRFLGRADIPHPPE